MISLQLYANSFNPAFMKIVLGMTVNDTGLQELFQKDFEKL